MLRVKNEASKIYYALKSIYQVFDEIVLVDNGSTDRTLEIAREFKTKEDKSDKIKIYFYPFTLARCGDENYGTPEDSVSSLAYYYNWTLSKCSCRYVCKWDGDMVLRRKRVNPSGNFLAKYRPAGSVGGSFMAKRFTATGGPILFGQGRD